VLTHVVGYGLQTAGVFPKIKYVCRNIFTSITHFLFADIHAVALENVWQFYALSVLQHYSQSLQKYNGEQRECCEDRAKEVACISLGV